MIILGCALHDSTAEQGFNLVSLKEGEAVLSDLGKLATDRSRFGVFLQALHCLHRGHNFGGGGALSVKEALDASPQTVHNRLPMIFNLKNPLSGETPMITLMNSKNGASIARHPEHKSCAKKRKLPQNTIKPHPKPS